MYLSKCNPFSALDDILGAWLANFQEELSSANQNCQYYHMIEDHQLFFVPHKHYNWLFQFIIYLMNYCCSLP